MILNASEQQIKDAALLLVQTRGYQGFSYADIAEIVKIRKASIHYYFPRKADLGVTLVRNYRETMRAQRERIDAVALDVEDKLRGFAQLFRAMLRDPEAEGGRICLCAILAAELPGLPEPVQNEVSEYYRETEQWLARLLEEGLAARQLRFLGPSRVQACGLMSGLAGAMLVARVQRDASLYCSIAHQSLAHLGLNVSEMEIAQPDVALSEMMAL